MSIAVLRDDRGIGLREPPPLPTAEALANHPTYYAPEAVLYDCPECGLAHLVVPECPNPSPSPRKEPAP